MVLSLALALAAPQQAPWVIGMEQISRLDLLPAFKRSVKIGAVTSYDRSGGNDDGFSGKYSFVAKEGEHLVLADLKGPGCIYRLHTPTPTHDPIEFYFDGETTPRISLPFDELFSGSHAPFVRPLVDAAGGGFTSYVPLPFKKSCKVILRGKHLQFYDLNYAIYPADAPVETFTSTVSTTAASAVFNGGKAKDLTRFNVPSGTKLTRHPIDAVLPAGKNVTLLDTKKPGRIASLRLGPSEAFVSKARDIWLRITWDGDAKPAVLCPIGDFFGYGWGKPAMASCLVGTYEGTTYCNLPMPFDRAAKVELVSLRGSAISVRGEIVAGDTGRRSYEGKFYALWRRENPTTPDKPFTFLDTEGRGHIVGLALQSQGMKPAETPFFEGDDQTTIDGELVIHGTGSEDFFNGGWYDVPGRWDGPVARPLSGCMTYQKHLGRTGAYRFMIGDAYGYTKSILQTIEHGPERNQVSTDYSGVTYFYAERPPVLPTTIPGLAMRTVVDPPKIVFAAHWALPIKAFSFNSATLSRKSIAVGTQQVRCLSMRNIGADWFGHPFISFLCELPATGRYRVSIDALKGPDGGKVQMFRDEVSFGEAIDLYAAKPESANGLILGEVDAAEGLDGLMIKIVDKNPASSALGFDLVNVIYERMR